MEESKVEDSKVEDSKVEESKVEEVLYLKCCRCHMHPYEKKATRIDDYYAFDFESRFDIEGNHIVNYVYFEKLLK